MNKKSGKNKLLTKSAFINSIVVILLALLLSGELYIFIVPIEGLWNKIIASCYATSATVLVIILGAPRVAGKVEFSSISIVSFAIWSIVIPVIIGSIGAMMIINKLNNPKPEFVGFWSIAICITIFSFSWFLIKLYKSSDSINRLDLYSTIWIALATIITTIFDLQAVKGAFVFLLAMYLILQILIKCQVCRMQENNEDIS